MNPESHLRYHRERHADLLREARESELAAKFVKTPRSRRSFLASGIWRKRFAEPAHARPRIERRALPSAIGLGGSVFTCVCWTAFPFGRGEQEPWAGSSFGRSCFATTTFSSISSRSLIGSVSNTPGRNLNLVDVDGRSEN